MRNEIEEGIRNSKIVSYSDLCKNTHFSKRNVSKILLHLVELGELVRIRRGIYVNIKKTDEFLIGNYLFNGYLGFSSALYLHKKKTEHPHTIYVVVKKNQKRRRVGDYIYIPVKTDFAFGSEYIGEYLVSNVPKTIFDMLSKPKYTDYEDVCNVIKQFEKSEWKQLSKYLSRFGGGAEISRAGYIAEICSAPKEIIKKIYKMRKKGVFYLKSSMKGKFVNRWRLYDDR